jgi:circadian clock protein KaiC
MSVRETAVGDRVATGIPGLDYILGGGFPANRLHLIEGTPGSGKTTLALQFLLHGVATGQKSLYITLSETRKAISAIKKRTGKHEATIRELKIDRSDIFVGPPLDKFRGVLTGVPITAEVLEEKPKSRNAKRK